MRGARIVFYQIYPNSFYDSNGQAIREKLETYQTLVLKQSNGKIQKIGKTIK